MTRFDKERLSSADFGNKHKYSSHGSKKESGSIIAAGSDRFEPRDSMTAILGFNYLDGVLMMADTEETTSFATKSDSDKLYRFTFPIGTVITGGAGDAHLIECANQELQTFFAGGGCQNPDTISSPQDILDGLNQFAQKFFQETTAQYAGFSLESVPGFDMLIAINYNRRSLLFRWTHNRVRWIPQGRHVSIGSGSTQLHPMLRDFEVSATKESTLFTGLRMMHYAKRTVQGVGGRTEAIALQHDGKTHYFGTDNTEKVEALVVNFEKFINQFLYLMVSNISPGVANLEENVKKGLSDIPGLLQMYRDQYREILAEQLVPPTSD